MDKISAALGAGALGLTALLIFLMQELRVERARLAVQEVPLAEPRHENLAGTALSAAVSPVEAPKATSPAARADMKREPADSSLEAKQLKAFQDPSYRASHLTYRKISARAKLHDLTDWMRISAQGLDGLATVLGEHSIQNEELHLRHAYQPDAQLRAQDALRQQQDSDLVQLLGARRFEEWKAYRDSARARGYLDDMNRELSGGDLLPAERVRPIALAMTRTQQNLAEEVLRLTAAERMPSGDAARLSLAEGRNEVLRRQDSLARAAAASGLSSKQLAALDTVIQRKQEEADLFLAIRRKRLGIR
jgi:hypothetical protein